MLSLTKAFVVFMTNSYNIFTSSISLGFIPSIFSNVVIPAFTRALDRAGPEGKYEPRSEKTGLRGFRPGPTQTGLYSHRK